ncbi:NAD(P)-binding protein [Glonium stellatum]|uniref:NAD(P)-binding protein n=1 Tax=Glonium stellatum TaxID=574774 RepID=A0A8E2ESE1_9PEZI|nr:NAD(P)-binding protein [Glonium stellatum]
MASASTAILVIGANRGIGFELATRLHRQGYTVFGTHRPQTRDDPSVKDLVREGINTFELDLTDEDSIVRASQNFGERKLDVLINCAGVYYLWDDKLFTEQTAEDLLFHFKVNVVGPFLTSKHFLRNLSQSKHGRIINISSDFASIAVLDNNGGNACYRISKCALNQLTKTTAVDLKKVAPTIHTLAVHPGFVPTKMTGFVGEDDMEECMTNLVNLVRNFASSTHDMLPNGGYVRWNGERMDY